MLRSFNWYLIKWAVLINLKYQPILKHQKDQRDSSKNIHNIAKNHIVDRAWNLSSADIATDSQEI